MKNKFKKGQKVVFINKSKREYAWPLMEYKEYKIEGLATDFEDFSNKKTYYYSVSYDANSWSSWYLEEDFIDLKKYRKLKLEKLNEKFIHE